MKTRWYPTRRVESIEDNDQIVPALSGVYVISCDLIIRRIRGEDHAGILYIGKAKNLQRRLRQFWNGYHSASGFLYQHPAIANKLFRKGIKHEDDVYDNLGKLRFRTAYPIHKASLERAERAALFAYIKNFGEPPPLNLSLPKRWEEAPSTRETRWAEKGILKNLG